MKKVLITGGTRGIGNAIAKLFKKNGYSVIITGTAENLKFDDFEYIQADFSKKDSTKNFFDKIKNIDIDVLVNNAGVNDIKLISDVNQESYDNIFNINLKVPYFLCKYASNSMKKRGGGYIINISSIMGVTSKEKRSLYSTTKSGLIGLTKALAIELGSENILVNCVSPGFTLTDLTKKSLSEKEIDVYASKIPLKRLANVNEIANIVLFMCSKENTYITGQNIIVDGGFTIV